MLGPTARCPSESLRNGVIVSVPGAALRGIATVSCIVVESASGLANNTESVLTTGPVVMNPRARTLIAVFPMTVTSMDLPSTAEAPENGLRILTSGGGTLPVAIISVSMPDEFPAPSTASAVIVTGVPGGGGTDQKSFRPSWKSVTAAVKVVSQKPPAAAIALKWMGFQPRFVVAL